MRILGMAVAVYGFIMLCYCQSFADGWHIETVDSAGQVGEYTSIALDSSGYPHISYHGNSNDDLKYAYWTGSSWSITSVDNSAEGVFWGTSIALDSSDYPHISYYDYYPNYDLKYACWTGLEWSITSVDTAGDVGWYTSIALDSSDYPHISYRDDTNTHLKYAYWNGSTWSITSVDSAAYVGMFTSIALDSSDYPHISYCGGSDDLKYAYWTGSAWSISTVDSAAPYVGYWTSIALDSEDNPHISYLDASNFDLKYAYWTGSAWSITSVDTAGYVGWETSIALDSTDNPHISYRDYTNDDLKYAWYGPNTGVNLTIFSALASDNAILLSWSVEATEGEQIAGFNLYRREIGAGAGDGVRADGHPPLQKDKTDDWTQVNPALITGQNPYEYTDGNVQGGLTYEYRLEAVLADESAQTLGTAQTTAEQPTTFAITRLYPNPASDMLTCLLSVPDAGLVHLELYDLSGRLVASQKLEATGATDMEAVIDVSSLTSGVYTVKATCNGVEANARCVVAK